MEMKTVGRGYWLAVLIVIGVIVDRAGRSDKNGQEERRRRKGRDDRGTGRNDTVFPVGSLERGR